MFIVIAGGGKVGSYLASVLLQSGNEVAVIEETLKTADQLSVMLEGGYLVIHGDGCDSRYQEDAGIRRADVFVATTGLDDSNLVACEIAQRVFHVPRVIARVNNPKNLRIFREVGIECVSSTTLIANLIEEEALLGSVSVVSSLTHGNVALTEVVVPRMRHHSNEAGVDIDSLPFPTTCSSPPSPRKTMSSWRATTWSCIRATRRSSSPTTTSSTRCAPSSRRCRHGRVSRSRVDGRSRADARQVRRRFPSGR